MSTTYKPLADRVLVKPQPNEQTTKSGIVLPDSAQEKPQVGTVIAVGPGRVTDDGKVIAINVKVNDKVLYAKYGGTEIKIDGQEHLLISERDLLAVQA